MINIKIQVTFNGKKSGKKAKKIFSSTRKFLTKKISPALVFATVVLSLVLALGINLVLAWTDPTTNPPGPPNVAAPINVSGTAQTKSGNLSIPNLNLNATGAEGNINYINQLNGYNDIFIRGNSTETAPVYLAGNQISIYTGGTERVRVDSSGALTVQGQTIINSSVQDAWGGWYDAIKFTNPAHAALYYPTGGLLFGLHSNRNFYWADTTNGWYSMYLQPAGDLTLRNSVNAPWLCIGGVCKNSWPGGSGFTGSGTANYVTKFTGSTSLGNSLVIDDGTTTRHTGAARFTGYGTDSWFPYVNGVNYLRGNLYFNGVLYDENNPGYYVDPNGTTRLNAVTPNIIPLTTGNSPNAGYNHYAIYEQPGTWTYPYPDLMIEYHTGISYIAYYGYGGHRFYTGYSPDASPTTLAFSVGEFDNNTRVYNNLYVSGTAYANGQALCQANGTNCPAAANFGDWYFSGDNLISNGWGHIYTTSSNLHLDSYNGGMYLNYYYNNWVTVGNADTGYLSIGNTRLYDDNDWFRIYSGANNRIYTNSYLRVDNNIENNGDIYSTTGFGGWASAKLCRSDGTNCPSGADGNNYTTGISFSGTTTKTLTLSRSGMSNLTASFTDEKGITAESDTLDNVCDRGCSTNQSMGVSGGLSVGGNLGVSGDISANGNSHGACYWTSYGEIGTADKACSDGYFMAGAGTRTFSGWTGFKIYCCRL